MVGGAESPYAGKRSMRHSPLDLNLFRQPHIRYGWSKRGWRQKRATRRAMWTSDENPWSSRIEIKFSYESHPPKVSCDLDNQASSPQGILIL